MFNLHAVFISFSQLRHVHHCPVLYYYLESIIKLYKHILCIDSLHGYFKLKLTCTLGWINAQFNTT